MYFHIYECGVRRPCAMCAFRICMIRAQALIADGTSWCAAFTSTTRRHFAFVTWPNQTQVFYLATNIFIRFCLRSWQFKSCSFAGWVSDKRGGSTAINYGGIHANWPRRILNEYERKTDEVKKAIKNRAQNMQYHAKKIAPVEWQSWQQVHIYKYYTEN